MSELLEGEAQVAPEGTPEIIMTSREWAADVLSDIALATEAGHYPHGRTAFDVGRALGRAFTNCEEDDWYKQMLRGIDHYESRKT